MTKAQARLFAIISTTLVTIAFLALTEDSDRKFPTLTNNGKLSQQVAGTGRKTRLAQVQL